MAAGPAKRTKVAPGIYRRQLTSGPRYDVVITRGGKQEWHTFGTKKEAQAFQAQQKVAVLCSAVQFCTENEAASQYQSFSRRYPSLFRMLWG